MYLTPPIPKNPPKCLKKKPDYAIFQTQDKCQKIAIISSRAGETPFNAGDSAPQTDSGVRRFQRQNQFGAKNFLVETVWWAQKQSAAIC